MPDVLWAPPSTRVSVDALQRVARVDVSTLGVIANYLESLDLVVTQSSDAAREVIGMNSAGGNGASAAPARKAVDTAITEVDQLLQAADGVSVS